MSTKRLSREDTEVLVSAMEALTAVGVGDGDVRMMQEEALLLADELERLICRIGERRRAVDE